MTVRELKQEIAALEPEARDEIATYLFQLKLEQDPKRLQEITRKRDDRRPESWVRLEDFEAQLAQGQK